MNIHKQKVLILDFGSQYTQLIARRIREQKVYCEIHAYNIDIQKIKDFAPRGIVLSGSPYSIYDKNAPQVSNDLYELGIPILGICYGMQFTVRRFKGRVEQSESREYGSAELIIDDDSDLFKDVAGESGRRTTVWMSHGDRVKGLPEGFIPIAHSENSPVAAMRDNDRKIYGVQFHPEVSHTKKGVKILRNFLFLICRCRPIWTMRSFIDSAIESIGERVKKNGVVCGLSGGVDSAVTAVLIHRAVGRQLNCIFVDNGLLRMDERRRVMEVFKRHFHMKVKSVNAGRRFLKRLKGVENPERKRKIIGNEFIHIFEEEAKLLDNVAFLAQGTLYPDVIESVSFKGPSATIKSHHNVGGLLKRMRLKLIEPLRELFKDEVRMLGRELGMPEEIITRHPFPGPGLAIRIVGEVTKRRCDILRAADSIVEEEIRSEGIYNRLWQAFAVLLPVRTVGVMGDQRTYDNVVAIRAVESVDGMTADWVRLPHDLIARISLRITNEVKGINRVVYDISSKPPSTIEWE